MNQELRLMTHLENRRIKKLVNWRNKSKPVRGVLNYIAHSLTAISTITGCLSISAFASLVGIPIGIATLFLVYWFL